ncbi:hypothetical protein [Listeria monocytogenes]|uniref:Uncharacterized protein n=1 Tax=Listeria monocytogenes TaxID=1639 RepID=A0A6C8N2U1_LISMN|nr:hypothetical protein [Listeria monocytogenes]KAA9534094.1 hypothetical protein DCK33_08105 [Listeria monocytogenes]KAA9541481.1 hypothetical protein DCK32_10360 [Listeria monocytogenes]HAB7745302.1 hypothetical protein [Listeria monocytogenes]
MKIEIDAVNRIVIEGTNGNSMILQVQDDEVFVYNDSKDSDESSQLEKLDVIAAFSVKEFVPNMEFILKGLKEVPEKKKVIIEKNILLNKVKEVAKSYEELREHGFIDFRSGLVQMTHEEMLRIFPIEEIIFKHYQYDGDYPYKAFVELEDFTLYSLLTLEEYKNIKQGAGANE